MTTDHQDTHADCLKVNLGPRSYPIHFGADLTAQVHREVEVLKAEGRLSIYIGDHKPSDVNFYDQLQVLRKIYGASMVFDVLLNTGETSETRKSVDGLKKVLDFLANNHIDRSGVIFAVGGGVIGDLAGFAAATYLRGIAYYQVPTTLLAMVDSSVGGKTGINLAAGKNLVGAFHQPKGVFISTNLLGTLPPREFAAGCAEVIKAGLLGDAELFARLERAPLTVTSGDLTAVIRRCCALKARVVEADEFETAKDGGRALLNLGHTFGHAIEQVTNYHAYLHGEAVAIGLCAAARLSQKLGLITAAETARVEQVVKTHMLPTRLKAPLPLAHLMAAMARDKKARGGRLRFVVLTALGTAVTRDDVDHALAEACFREVGAV